MQILLSLPGSLASAWVSLKERKKISSCWLTCLSLREKKGREVSSPRLGRGSHGEDDGLAARTAFLLARVIFQGVEV